MNEIIKQEDSLDLTNKLNTIKKAVFNANAPKEMLSSVITLAETKDVLKQAEKIMKDSIAEPKKIITELKKMIADVEADVKNKVIDTYKSEIVVKQHTDEETGEVTFKEYKNNNLGKNLFTWTDAKKVTSEAVNYKAILEDPEKYEKYLVPVTTYKIAPSIMNISIEDAKELGLPTSTQSTETGSKVGIQWVQIKKTIAERQAKIEAEKKEGQDE